MNYGIFVDQIKSVSIEAIKPQNIHIITSNPTFYCLMLHAFLFVRAFRENNNVSDGIETKNDQLLSLLSIGGSVEYLCKKSHGFRVLVRKMIS